MLHRVSTPSWSRAVLGAVLLLPVTAVAQSGGAESQPAGAESQPAGAESQPAGAESQPAGDAKKSGDDAKAAPAEPKVKPKKLTLRPKEVEETYLLQATLEPGIPEPGDAATLKIQAARKPEVPDPRYGDRIPLKDQQLYARITLAKFMPPEPKADEAKGKKKRRKRKRRKKAKAPVAPSYERWMMVPRVGDAGSYGMHFTPPAPGFYDVKIYGADPAKKGGKRFEYTFEVPIGVWPLPEEFTAQASVAPEEEMLSRRRGSLGDLLGGSDLGGVGRRPIVAGGGGQRSGGGSKLAGVMKTLADRMWRIERALREAPEDKAKKKKRRRRKKKNTGLNEAQQKQLLQWLAEASELGGAIKDARPPVNAASTPEFQALAGKLDAAQAELKSGIERGAAPAELVERIEKARRQSCTACHAKFWWGATRDISKFE